jgi:putative membrane protein
MYAPPQMFTYLLVSWLSLSFLLWVTGKLVPGFHVNGLRRALVVGAIFGVLMWALSGPLYVIIGVSTLSLGFIFKFVTKLVVSAILLKLADALTDHLTIRGFMPALIGAVVMSVVSSIENWLFH